MNTRTIRPEIKKASDRKILRKQMELISEYCFNEWHYDNLPNMSEAMTSVYRHLLIAKYGFVIWIEITLFALLYFIKGLHVKGK